jgi:hypothetical protein
MIPVPALSLGLLEWDRPLALFAAIVPVLVWILARTGASPPRIATGTLAIWCAVAARMPAADRRARARPSLALWLAIASLALGVIALAAPRVPLAPAARVWRLYLDRRPAMYLRDRETTRIEHAVAAARSWIEKTARPDDGIVWIDSIGSRAETVSGREPPAEWTRAPRIPREAPDWRALDDRGAVWITDREPEIEPLQATLVLSGGESVPGPIDASGTTRWDWDGERIVAVPNGVAVRRVAIDGDLARPLARMLEAWAASRGLAIDPRSSAEVALRVRTVRGSAVEPIEAGRDGWRARGEISGSAAAADEDGPLGTWLDAPTGSMRRALISRGSGRISSAWLSMEEPEGDPAAFAVSLASLFDACVLPPPGVVELRDRLSVGSVAVKAPKASSSGSVASGGALPPERSGSPVGARAREPALRLDAWFALAAFACALLALTRTRALRGVAPPAVARARSIG